MQITAGREGTGSTETEIDELEGTVNRGKCGNRPLKHYSGRPISTVTGQACDSGANPRTGGEGGEGSAEESGELHQVRRRHQRQSANGCIKSLPTIVLYPVLEPTYEEGLQRVVRHVHMSA